ncbi:chaperone djlA [Teredinibacter turnerae T7901]|uniref:Co-chaperone protein DjlA n=1 Tax=Teredinibacter turnerae (strain ATCC 39867 / T7901) TaxID=377629 RepID=C5BI20_TERTT|nr:co-chaperone DjlA [Teredinibacter turnerae]ACR12307.1 chaperone djlA [Teredinibacter turnerae T7901]
MLGKIIAGLIGFLTLGPFGAILGVLIGHFFDHGRQQFARRFDPEQRAKVETAFFNAVFPLLGHLAKADGRVSEEEVSGTEQLMAKMGLGVEARKKAIALFQQGAQSDFNPHALLDDFNLVCGKYPDLKQMILVYLISLAYADNHLHEQEEKVLADIASTLGYSSFAFNHLLGMVKAQAHFYRNQQGRQSPPQPREDELILAYRALGVDASISDAQLKSAYRKLMSEYHPDKLAGRGVPEDMLKVATERAQEIQAAYDLIKKHRRG